MVVGTSVGANAGSSYLEAGPVNNRDNGPQSFVPLPYIVPPCALRSKLRLGDLANHRCLNDEIDSRENGLANLVQQRDL
jgi:hypothetical protein